MPKTPYNFIAHFKAQPGRQDDLQRILTEIVEPTRAEPGCLNYDLHRVIEDPSRFVLYEGWRSEEALKEHMKEPHFLKLMRELESDVAEKGPDGKPFQAEALTMLTEVIPHG